MMDTLERAIADSIGRAMFARTGLHISVDGKMAATRAALAAIEASGTHVVVPIIPTDDMLAEADSSLPRFQAEPDGSRTMGVAGARECWGVMIGMRPRVTP